jgi:hypothetical protein
MIPKRNAGFYKLDKMGKSLYLTGMPEAFITAPKPQVEFRNETLPKGVLLSSTQMKYWQDFKSVEPSATKFCVFTSKPTSHDSLAALCELLRQQRQRGFKDFEFVHPEEFYPREETKRRSLYILTGVHASDPSIVHQVRRWVCGPHGAAVWLNLTVGREDKAYEWLEGKLGVLPQFLFSLKSAGVSVG